MQEDVSTLITNDPEPLPEPAPPLSREGIAALLREAAALETTLGRIAEERTRALAALAREASRLRPEALRESRLEIEQRALAAVDGLADAIDRLSRASAAQAAHATPEAALQSAEFETGSRELAFRARVERADADTLRVLAEAAFHASDLARLRILVEEIAHRGHRFDLAVADRVRRLAHATAERIVADSPAHALAEATRRLRNARARLGRGRLELTPAEIEAMPQPEYEALRSSGAL